MSDTKEPDTKQKVTDAAKRVRNKLGKFGKKALDKLPSTGLKVGAFAVGMAALAPNEVHAEDNVPVNTKMQYVLDDEGNLQATASTVDLSGKPVSSTQIEVRHISSTEDEPVARQPSRRELRTSNTDRDIIWNSLPRHVREEIKSMDYDIDVEYSRGLNNALTPDSKNKKYIVFAVACKTQIPGQYVFLPFYERNPRNHQKEIQPKTMTERAAYNARTTHQGPYKPHPELFPTHSVDLKLPGGVRVKVDDKDNYELQGPGIRHKHDGRTGSSQTKITAPNNNRKGGTPHNRNGGRSR